MDQRLKDKIKAEIKKAMLAKNDSVKSILKVFLGEVELVESRENGISDERITKIAEKLIDSNKETIDMSADDPEKVAVLTAENECLSEFVPEKLSYEEVLNQLSPLKDEIKRTGHAGKATGLAMKHFKSQRIEVDGSMVKKAVTDIFENEI